MKLLWLSHRDPLHPKSGGGARSVYETSRRLVQAGIEVTVLAPRFKGSAGFENLDGIQIVRPGGNVGVHIEVMRLVRGSLAPDIVLDDLAHAVPWLSEWLLGKPSICFFRHLHTRTLPGQVGLGTRVTLSLFETLYPVFYRKTPFVTESQSSAEDLVRIGIPQSRITLIPPGVDTEVFRPGPRTPFPSIVYFGGFREYKRAHLAVRAFGIFLHSIPTANLTLIGEGPTLRGALEEADKLGIRSHVSHVGRVSDTELSRIVSGAWLNINSTKHEGWGLSVMEAAACGVPTVAFDVGGVREAVPPDQIRLLAHDNDVKEMASLMESALEAKDALSVSSLKWARLHSWGATSSKWVELFRLALSSTSANH